MSLALNAETPLQETSGKLLFSYMQAEFGALVRGLTNCSQDATCSGSLPTAA